MVNATVVSTVHVYATYNIMRCTCIIRVRVHISKHYLYGYAVCIHFHFVAICSNSS